MLDDRDEFSKTGYIDFVNGKANLIKQLGWKAEVDVVIPDSDGVIFKVSPWMELNCFIKQFDKEIDEEITQILRS